MTVKEIFDLRRQGRVEEAYDAIRPLYAAHKGRYTTLCMFWTAADVFGLRLEQKRCDEAGKILEALKRMLPRVEEVNRQLDSEASASPRTGTKYPWEHEKQQSGTSASAFIQSAERRLAKAKETSIAANETSNKEKLTADSRQLTSNDTPAPGGDNLQDLSNFVSASEQEKPEPLQDNNLQDLLGLAQQEEFPSRAVSEGLNDRLLHDHSGRLIVSLDEGIIRPVEDINALQRVVLACIVGHPGYSVPQISASTGMTVENVERHVAALIARSLIEPRIGKQNTVEYYLTQ